ncbi:MAG: hypothetical protein NTX85_02860 [Candidatus Nomurabacteria bacterium]|nr:hypothetical protein [Candidatus Nomurabacteria bacterium]
MNLDELRKNIDEEEINTKSSIEKLREEIHKRELMDLKENKEFYENQLLDEFHKDINENDIGKKYEYLYRLLKWFKKIGILSAFVDYSFLLSRIISWIQGKLNLYSEVHKENKRNRWIITFLLAIAFALPLVILKKILIKVLMG